MMQILVDGYNVLYAMPEFHSGKIRRDIEAGRKLLAGMLMRYARASGERVTLVFDGRGRDSKKEWGGGAMSMAFAPDADEYIADAVRASSAPGSVCVVTSDRELREEIKSLGGKRKGPKSFLREMKESIREKAAADMDKPGKLTEEEVVEWLKEFGFLEDGRADEQG